MPDDVYVEDFGETSLGTPVTMQFGVTNVGSSDLVLRALRAPEGFSVSDFQVNTLDPGLTTYFNVTLKAQLPGQFEGCGFIELC